MFKRARPWPEVPLPEIIKRAQVLVVDDQEFPYKPLFERDGYNVDKWDDVESVAQLEQAKYDLILLDLQGVGGEHSVEEGLGVLKHIRTACPAQIVIAYSNADWPVKYQPFFEMADAVLQKTADYLDFKRAVDDLLTSRFSKGFYLSRIEAELAAHVSALPKLHSKVERALAERDVDPLRRYLSRRVEDPAVVDRALSIAEVAIGVAGLWIR